jgi:hypothetical protein
LTRLGKLFYNGDALWSCMVHKKRKEEVIREKLERQG